MLGFGQLGFYIILAAQFLSALADNALLFVAIAMLQANDAPEWQTPVLQAAFIFSYIVLAPFVGAFADALPKGRVMFFSNNIKILGCGMMLYGVDPLLAYACVGLGAAAYSPAKYGILTEYLPTDRLVKANSWMEGLTVAAIVLGAILGGLLVTERFSTPVIQLVGLSGDDAVVVLAMIVVMFLYIAAALFNLYIPRVEPDHKPLSTQPVYLLKDFIHCFKLLWKDPLGQVSLAVTTLFWGAGATLRLIVLAWAVVALEGYKDLGQAAQLTAWVAVGIALGSVLAAKWVRLDGAVKVLPLGVLMGVLVILMIPVTNSVIAIVLLILIGALGGFFVVPMNALLQHRGHVLMGAGRSIAVQNFNENLSIFVMLGFYALLQKMEVNLFIIIFIFGALLSSVMFGIYHKHKNDRFI